MSTVLGQYFGASKRRALLTLSLLVTLNAWLFHALGVAPSSVASVSFLDVGQGDATLVTVRDGVQMLIDGGPPNGFLMQELGALLPPHDREIELVFLTHPELDHYGGLIDLIKRYGVGAFIDTGVTKDVDAYKTLIHTIEQHGIRRIMVRAGDRIRYDDHVFEIISPDERLAGANETNDTSMVMTLEAGPPGGKVRFLFTGDISANVERTLTKIFTTPFDVLKVAHHGSKFSSTAEFLAAVHPSLAAIGVGKNSYGHPTPETLSRLASSGAHIYRTDRDGTVTVRIKDRALQVFAEQKER